MIPKVDERLRMLATIYEELLRRVASWRWVPREAVDEIVSNTTKAVIDKAALPTDPEEFKAWVFAAARVKAKEWFRDRGRAREVPVDMDALAERIAAEDEREKLERELAHERMVQGVRDEIEKNPKLADHVAVAQDQQEGKRTLREAAKTRGVPEGRLRVSVLRSKLYLKEVALLAAGALLLLVVTHLKRPEEPGPDTTARLTDEEAARTTRSLAERYCAGKDWAACNRYLDDAKRLDPAGDTAPSVQDARRQAQEALRSAAADLRQDAKDACAAEKWDLCLSKLDAARAIDPEGDQTEEAQKVRRMATARSLEKDKGK